MRDFDGLTLAFAQFRIAPTLRIVPRVRGALSIGTVSGPHFDRRIESVQPLENALK